MGDFVLDSEGRLKLAIEGVSGASGWSGFSGLGFSGPAGESGTSGVSGFSSQSGISGFSGDSGYSGASGFGESGFSGFSGSLGISGFSGSLGTSGYSGFSGTMWSGVNQFVVAGSGYTGSSGGKIPGWSTTVYSGVKYRLTVDGGSMGYIGFKTRPNMLYAYEASGAANWDDFYGPRAKPYFMNFSPSEDGLLAAEFVWTGGLVTNGYGAMTLYNDYGPAGDSGASGVSGWSGFSGAFSGISGYSGASGTSGGIGLSGYSGKSGYSGLGLSGLSGVSGYSGPSGLSGGSGYSAYSGISGYSGFSGAFSGQSGFSGVSGFSGTWSGFSGYSGATANPYPSDNIIDNASMRVCQRSTYYSSRKDNQYFWDRWYVLNQTAAITCSRDLNANFPSSYAAKMLQPQASAQRFGIAQIIPATQSLHARGSNMYLSFTVYHDIGSAQNIRYALLWWSGTADSVTSDVVNDWTSSTYTAGNFFKSTTTSVVFCDVASVNDSTYTRVSRSISAAEMGSATDANNKNLILVIWSEGTVAQNKSIFVSCVDLFHGTQSRDFQEIPYSIDLTRCMRYYLNLYDNGGRCNIGMGAIYATNSVHFIWTFPVPMRTSPSLVITSTNFALYSNGGLRNVSSILSGGRGLGPDQDMPTLRISGVVSGAGGVDTGCIVYTNGAGYVEAKAEL